MTNLSVLLQRLLGDNLAKLLFGKGFAAFLIKLASAVTSYVMLVAFAKLLGAEDFGRFGTMLNLAILLSAIAGFGLPTAIMRFWPTHLERSETALARGAVFASFGALSIATVVLLALALLLGATGVLDNTLGSTHVWLLIALLAAGFSLGDYLSGALRAQGSTIWALAPRDIFWRILAPVLAWFILLASGQSDAQTAILSCIIVLAAVCLAQLVRHLRLTGSLAGNTIASYDWKGWGKPLLPLWGAGILFALVQQFDVIIVSSLLGPTEAGSYFAAQKTASLLGLVMVAGGMVAAPLMAASFHAGRMDELQRLCRLLALAIAVSTLIGLAVMAVIGGYLLAVFNPAYADAYGILMILSAGFAVDAMAGPSAYLMQMTKLEWTYLRLMAAVYALVIALQLTFVPSYGVVAAAAASAFGVIIWNLLAVYLLRREIGVDPSILSVFRRGQVLTQDNPS